MTEEQLSQLRNHVEKEIAIPTDSAVLEKSRTAPYLTQRYISLLSEELFKAKKLAIVRSRLYKKLYQKYRFGQDIELPTNREVESHINGDEEMVALDADIAFQGTVVQFLEDTVDNLKKLQFSIKNYIDLKKFLAGS